MFVEVLIFSIEFGVPNESPISSKMADARINKICVNNAAFFFPAILIFNPELHYSGAQQIITPVPFKSIVAFLLYSV